MNRPLATPAQPIEYPDDDGLPMSDNTLQFEWITKLQNSLDSLFAGNPDVFVGGNLLWYPVEGDNKTRQAPDVMVVFGRPKIYRGSYRQWEEAGIAPQVVFEVLSIGNRPGEMRKKFQFYERFAVEEYYVYDPYAPKLTGYVRDDDTLEPISQIDGFTSPRLGVRFDMSGEELLLHGPHGPLQSYLEIAEERDRIAYERDREKAKLEQLAAKLRELGIDPDQITK